jgi:hypothetical protein
MTIWRLNSYVVIETRMLGCLFLRLLLICEHQHDDIRILAAYFVFHLWISAYISLSLALTHVSHLSGKLQEPASS